MPAPWFFERLDLAPSRDVKTIKRAYAVALKRIDQQHEREAFERLRLAYEQALAWAARQEDEDEEEYEDEDDSDPDDSYDEEADEPAPMPPPAATPQADRSPSTPPADPVTPEALQASQADPAPPEAPLSSSTPPGNPPPAPPAPSPAIAFVTRAESQAAVGAWLARLLAAPAGEHAGLLTLAMLDPGMAHLDSQTQLEAQVADTLHAQPGGRAPLFQAAAEFFRWTDRHAQAAGLPSSARWIGQVIDQGLQWQEQPKGQLAPQSAALKAAREIASPSRSKAHRLCPTLEAVHAKFPDWLSLQLPPGRLGAWKEAHAALTPGWLRWTRLRKRYAGSLPRIFGSLMLLSIVLSVGQALINGAMSKSDAPAAASTPQVVDLKHLPEGADEAGQEPTLAYEFMGAVTQDSCEQAHEFIHESNWLEVGDTDAKSLLITRSLLCQQKKLWPQKTDSMMDCLRLSRIAALSAQTVEDPRDCAKLMTTPKPQASPRPQP
jgi:hypothetical protein